MARASLPLVTAAVTPAGVRDGHPDALAGLCARRGPGVLAYCERVAGEQQAVAATAEAFRRFRAAVVAASDLTELNPEALLISATRHAAAEHVPAPPESPDVLRFVARRPATGWCGDIPLLLAARADRTISRIDLARLEQHLAGCPACRAPEARFKAAERVYRDPPDTPLPNPVTEAITAALAAAAPVCLAEAAAAPSENGAGRAHAESVNGAEAMPPGHAGVQARPPAEPLPAAPPAAPAPFRAPSEHGANDTDVATAEHRLSDFVGVGREHEPGAMRARRRFAMASLPPLSWPRAWRRRRPRRERGARRARIERPARGSASADSRREAGSIATALPVVLVAGAIVVALAIAGAFGGGETATPTTRPPAPPVPADPTERPVVVVPGDKASGAAVEAAKARARAKARRQQSSDTAAPVQP